MTKHIATTKGMKYRIPPSHNNGLWFGECTTASALNSKCPSKLYSIIVTTENTTSSILADNDVYG